MGVLAIMKARRSAPVRDPQGCRPWCISAMTASKEKRAWIVCEFRHVLTHMDRELGFSGADTT